jgi:Nop14-like family
MDDTASGPQGHRIGTQFLVSKALDTAAAAAGQHKICTSVSWSPPEHQHVRAQIPVGTRVCALRHRERAATKRLKRQVQKERRGAMRELRKDAAFLDAEREKVRAHSAALAALLPAS